MNTTLRESRVETKDSKGWKSNPCVRRQGGATLGWNQRDNQPILVPMDAATYNVNKTTCDIYYQNRKRVTLWSLPSNPSFRSGEKASPAALLPKLESGSSCDDRSSGTNWSVLGRHIAMHEASHPEIGALGLLNAGLRAPSNTAQLRLPSLLSSYVKWGTKIPVIAEDRHASQHHWQLLRIALQ